MICVITIKNKDGTFNNIGTLNRCLQQDLKTKNGYIKRSKKIYGQKDIRLEFFPYLCGELLETVYLSYKDLTPFQWRASP